MPHVQYEYLKSDILHAFQIICHQSFLVSLGTHFIAHSSKFLGDYLIMGFPVLFMRLFKVRIMLYPEQQKKETFQDISEGQ